MVPYNHKHDFLPSREAQLVQWSANFNARINTPPGPGSFGLTPAQATAYAALHSAYATAYAVAVNPQTNSKANVIAKNSAKAALKANARMLARLINATPGITNDQRAALGLTVPDEHLTPVAAPSDPPLLTVLRTMGRTVRIRLRDKSSPTRRGKPPGIAGAVVMYYVGSASENDPPAQMSQWSFAGNAMRTLFDITFPSDAPAGERLWITACWFNTRGKNGPFSTAAMTRLGDGVGMFSGALRLAA